jgi:hypothetical protein
VQFLTLTNFRAILRRDKDAIDLEVSEYESKEKEREKGKPGNDIDSKTGA